jgi:hypothetical protein
MNAKHEMLAGMKCRLPAPVNRPVRWNLEGILAKQADSSYREDARKPHWGKIKIQLTAKERARGLVQACRLGVIMPHIGAVKAAAISIVAFMHGRPGRA